MSQSVVIFGTLLFLFLVYVTSKGQLPAYLAIFGLKPPTSQTGNGLTTTPSTVNPLQSLTPIQPINTSNISSALPNLSFDPVVSTAVNVVNPVNLTPQTVNFDGLSNIVPDFSGLQI